MKLKTLVSVWVVLVCIIFVTDAWAKRTRASAVEPVVYKGIRYVAPNDEGRRAYVQAWDAATNNKLWEVTVFENRINPLKEEDVQWVYIKCLQIENDKLVVTDEGDRQFAVDLKDQKVERIKGNKTANKSPEDIGTNAPNLQHRR